MRDDSQPRLTKQRRIILEELRKVQTHPSADEVYEMVRKRLPKISLATVYRNLNLLSSCGLIRTLTSASSQMRFDGNPENHYHLRCVKCDRIVDLPIEMFAGLDECVQNTTGHVVFEHNLEFQGICRSCHEHHHNEGRSDHVVERHKN